MNMGRIENKYLVPARELANLRDAFMPFVEPDGYMRPDDNEYRVHSIYYDTASFAFYHEKMAGIQHRTKVRVRGYNEGHDESKVFLEIKRKNDAVISKYRAPVLFRNVRALFETRDIRRFVLNGNGNPRSHDDANRFFYQVFRHSLLPIVNVHYDREAYFYKFDRSVRITFDKNIRSTIHTDFGNLFSEESARPSLRGEFVLEVKYCDTITRGMPLWLEDTLGRFRLKRTAVSKYCICLDEHVVPGRTPACGVFSSFSNGCSMKGS